MPHTSPTTARPRRGVAIRLAATALTMTTTLALAAPSSADTPAPLWHEATAPTGPVLWQIGIDDASNAEFTGPQPQRFAIPNDWQARTAPGSAWPDFNKKAVANRKRPITIDYTLDAVPVHGVELQLAIQGSTKLVPQLAVYSNTTLAGIIQTWGYKGTAHGKTHDFRRVYRLYLPAQLLKPGANELQLDLLPQPYGGPTGIHYFDWDFLRLTAHDQPVNEPVHGSVIFAGTNLTLGADGPAAFHINKHQVRLAPHLLEWLGLGYGGNLMRAPYWSNVAHLQDPEYQTKLLETYRDLNLRVVLNTLYLGGFSPDADGELPETQRVLFDRYLERFADLVQFVEVANEPGLIGPLPYENVLAFTQYVQASVPEHVRVLGPGWAFNTWAGDADKRLAIEEHASFIGGHAYGLSFNNHPGGSFMEQVPNNHPTGPTLGDGLSKPLINTEFGSNEWHRDSDAGDLSTQPQAAAFDRNMRAHVAVAHGFMQHAVFFNHKKKKFEKFSLMVQPDDYDTHDVFDTQAFPGVEGQDSRLQSFRRLTLAYATHGSPLPWQLHNAADLAYTPVYVRAVDTSTLPALRGSGGTSDKTLINLVNFTNEPQTVEVEVTLPAPGQWTGKRYGPGETLRDAVSDITLNARPTVTVRETLPPRDSVQLILTPPSP
ncbi:MAG: polysaccharide lyase family protein [Planctomycetota bacterium]